MDDVTPVTAGSRAPIATNPTELRIVDSFI